MSGSRRWCGWVGGEWRGVAERVSVFADRVLKMAWGMRSPTTWWDRLPTACGAAHVLLEAGRGGWLLSSAPRSHLVPLYSFLCPR